MLQHYGRDRMTCGCGWWITSRRAPGFWVEIFKDPKITEAGVDEGS